MSCPDNTNGLVNTGELVSFKTIQKNIPNSQKKTYFSF